MLEQVESVRRRLGANERRGSGKIGLNVVVSSTALDKNSAGNMAKAPSPPSL